MKAKAVFVLASNHFRKYFSINAGIWLHMENKFSRKYFQLTMCFNGFDPEMVWSENFQFKPFPDSRAKTEREREEEERAQSSNRAPVRQPQQRTPQTELQSNDPHSTDLVDRSIAPIKQRSTPTPLDLASATRSHLRIHRTISPLDQTQSPLSLPFSLNLTEFDEIFFLGFVSFVFLYWLDLMNFFPGFCFFCVSILRNDIIYLFDSWENVRKCEQ